MSRGQILVVMQNKCLIIIDNSSCCVLRAYEMLDAVAGTVMFSRLLSPVSKNYLYFILFVCLFICYGDIG